MSDERADALMVSDQPEHFPKRQLIVALAEKYRLPMMWPYRPNREFAAPITYGVDLLNLTRVAATQIDQILKGANPGDIPIQQPTKFELVINMRAAKSIGLSINPSLLTRADEVIE
jgi:putative ABC transport system substrate-binding protein